MDERISDRLASLIETFTVGCRAARRGMIPDGSHSYVKGQNAVVFGCGTIGIAAAVAFSYFGMEKQQILTAGWTLLGQILFWMII